MASKKGKKPVENKVPEDVVGLRAEVLEQPIVDTLETNYMPYAMSVIVSRAIPEIDGFKPSHRKLLYTMYTMGLLSGGRTKSANIVGATMKLNPHGDAAIYDTMVRLSKGYEALLAPFVDSKGNFGKIYSRDMAYAASRYTEAKLSAICNELFRDIGKDTVDFVDNYDGTIKEPTLLPTTFPNILVSANQGIAVGMASSVCGFNLAEVCRAEIEYLEDENFDLMSVLTAPDFPTGGEIVYNREQIESIYNTGRGTFKLRGKWRYDSKLNLIEITEIPYTTTAEAIIDKVEELIKSEGVKEIADMRDETDINGLKLTIDLKRGADPEKLMKRLMKQTTLEDSVSCNFNVLIAGAPRVMGVREILEEWTAWRIECVKRRVHFELTRKKERLHLLKGLGRILLDIDKAIKIIRETEMESEVVPNLMIGFGIDEVQAEYVAEIKLRNINREYILKQTRETDALEKEIEELAAILASKKRVRGIISSELKEVIKKYGEERKTGIIYENEIEVYDPEEHIEDYPVTLFLSREGYFKKITPLSLRMSGAQKYKEEDGPFLSMEASNKNELLVLSDKQQMYKTRVSAFEDSKASLLGTYLPQELKMDADEKAAYMLAPEDYKGFLLFVFENGKAAKVPLSAYETKTNRRKLTAAYSDKSPLAGALYMREDALVAVYSTDDRTLVFNTALLALKPTRNSQGVSVMSVKKKHKIKKVCLAGETSIKNLSRYRVRTLPAAGALLKSEDAEEQQMELDI